MSFMRGKDSHNPEQESKKEISIEVWMKEYKSALQQEGMAGKAAGQLASLFKGFLKIDPKEDLENGKYSPLFKTFKELILAGDSDREALQLLFKEQLEELSSSLVTSLDTEEDDDTEEDSEEEEFELDDDKKRQEEVPPGRVVSQSIVHLQACVEGIRELKSGLRGDDEIKSAVVKIRDCFSVWEYLSPSELSKKLIEQYFLGEIKASSQSFSSSREDLQGFMSALISEVRRRSKEPEESIRNLIAESIIAFNGGKANYELWIASMAQSEEDRQNSIEVEVSRQVRSKTREYKLQTQRAAHALTDAQTVIEKQQESLEDKQREIQRVEEKLRQSALLHKRELEKRDKLLHDQVSVIKELRMSISTQDNEIARLRRSIKIKEDLLEKNEGELAELGVRIGLLEKDKGDSAHHLGEKQAEIDRLKDKLAAAMQKSLEMGPVRKEQKIEVTDRVRRSSFAGEPLKFLLNPELNQEKEKLAKLEIENASLKTKLAELTAAISVPSEKKDTLHSADLKQSNDLVYCIEKIVLPDLIEREDNHASKQAILKVQRIIRDLKAGQVTETEYQVLNKYVRSYLKDYCLFIINELHKNKGSADLIKNISVYYNILSGPSTITTAQLRSMVDELELVGRMSRPDSKSVPKNDSYFTEKDLSSVFAAFQAEEIRGNGWKIDTEKMQQENGIYPGCEKFTVPLVAEKSSGLWFNKQTATLKFSKAADGSIKITHSPKKVEVGVMVSRIAKDISQPAETRKFIDKNNKHKEEARKNARG